ncbi:MAG TPA: hypothetical protein VJ489_03480 [Thermoplasmata archaeon]|nr:hypothetical protein [Thermoplasmata archaeon]
MELMEFLTVLVLVFALFMLLAGIFTAYFGSGKSRMIGVALLVVGLVVGIIWVALAWGAPESDTIDVDITEVAWSAFLYILAGLVGALAAIGVFLVAIMKS